MQNDLIMSINGDVTDKVTIVKSVLLVPTLLLLLDFHVSETHRAPRLPYGRNYGQPYTLN